MFIKPPQNVNGDYGFLDLENCLAKTKSLSGRHIPGHTVLEHCILTGLVADQILSKMPHNFKKIFPEESAFICALHDIGKLNPAFQRKIYAALGDDKKGLKCSPDKDKEWGYHFSIGYSYFNDVSNKDLAFIVGSHHGGRFVKSESSSLKYGGKRWQEIRNVFVSEIADYFKVKVPIQELSLSDKEKFLLSGLTCVSDWLASSDELQSLIIDDTEKDNTIKKITNLICEAKLDYSINVKTGLSFQDIFNFSPNDFQKQTIEQLDFNPGLYLIEAPMGMGKTELALYIAYRLLEKEQAKGIYFALPTCLTSNSMYVRFVDFVKKISPEWFFVNLIHSMNWMFEFGSDASSSGPWSSNNRKAILAPFSVGTIDQALLSVLNVYFFFVRMFGLFGKVVILDEVHSYDLYTSTIIQSLISMLLKYDATVIILSATLSDNSKNFFLGQCVNAKEKDSSILMRDSYPQVLHVSDDSNKSVDINLTDKKEVVICLGNNDMDCIFQAIDSAKAGAQVLWIENTVVDAQETYKRIGANIGGENIEIGLIHSRFVRIDRDNKERYWIEIFGKNGSDKRKGRGRILIGTQVLEQSLDIDADFLITRIAPIDMLLQRMGRLWRHRQLNSLRPVEVPKTVVLSPSFDDVKDGESFGRTGAVYAPYYLYRTLEVMQDINRVVFPSDIRPILNKVYEEREESEKIAKTYLGLLEKKKNILIGRALNSLSRWDGNPIPDEEYTTRYIEESMERVDVLLVKEFDRKNKKFVLYDGTLIDLALKKHGKERRKVYLSIMENSVPVPRRYLPNKVDMAILDLFAPFVFLGKADGLDYQNIPFYVCIYSNKSRYLLDFNYGALNCSYDSEVGYIKFKKEDRSG